MNKINLDLLIDVKGLSSVDMSRPDLGNPGMGGTQFCFLLLAFYLNKLYNDKFIIRILSYEPLHLPSGIRNVVVSSLKEALNAAANSILVLRQFNSLEPYKLIKNYPNANIILWSHNFLFAPEADFVATLNNIKANVFVSKQMYDFYLDHDIILKSRPIFNMVPVVSTPQRSLPVKPVITFMGQISRSKGIITLLKIWKRVSSKCPEAILNIVGKGNLYSRDTPVGPLGITDADTERLMLPYITLPDGSPDPRVNFCGILGNEKYQLFASSTVGIVNPSANTETFGLGIIEMASASLPVVTRAWNGHPDTAINNKTALLAISVKGMADKVLKLIRNPQLNIQLGNEARIRTERFAPEVIAPQWAELIQSVANHTASFPILSPSAPLWNNYKFLRAVNSFLRYKCHLSFIPATVHAETAAYNFLKSLKRTLKT